MKRRHTNIRENFSFLGFYAESNYSFVQTFRDNLSISSSKVKQSEYPSSWIAGPLKRPSCPETSATNYHCILRKISKERNFIYTATQALNHKYVRVSECHLGQCHWYVLVDQCRLRHQHVNKRVFQCWCSNRGTQVPLITNWYTTTPCILQLNSRYRRKYMLLVCLLECIKLNNARPTFKLATWSSDSLLDVRNVARQNFQNIGYFG